MNWLNKIILLLLIVSCKSEMRSNNEIKIHDKMLPPNVYSTKTINWDSLPISTLPIGSINLFTGNLTNKENIFFTNINNGIPYEPNIQFVNNTVSKGDLINISYKYQTKYLYNYHFLYYNDCSSKDAFLNFEGRIPDIAGFKVLIFKGIDIIDSYLNIEDIMSLVILDSTGQKISDLNICNTYTRNASEGFEHGYRYYKKFLIQDDLVRIIYIKTSGEEVISEVLYQTTYKISKSGKIIRWFEEDNSFYHSEYEDGKIKNHLKDSVWNERFGFPEHVELGYDIVTSGMSAFIEYKEGIAISGAFHGPNIKYFSGNRADEDSNLLLEINPITNEIVKCNSPR